MVVIGKDKELALPGDVISEDPSQAGDGTFIDGGRVKSMFFGIVSRGKKVRVIPIAGKYYPSVGDLVIGKIVDSDLFGWKVDINSPYESFLHISQCPGKVEGGTTEYLRIGDVIVAKVINVDPVMRVNLTMNGESLGVLRQGGMVEISPTRIPRLVGRGGSMIKIIKEKTGCNMIVSPNGRIWMNGGDIERAIAMIRKVDEEAHTSGLTDRVAGMFGDAETGEADS